MSTIWIYDIIGFDGSSSKAVASQLAAMPKTERAFVRINSDGGKATEGEAIYHLLRRHPGGVTVEIDGVAASAASVIAMAGDTVNMARGAWIMIHESWGGVFGNKTTLRGDLETYMSRLSAIDELMVSRYSERTGIDRDKLHAMIISETWLNTEEAIAMKFADASIPEIRAMAYVEQDMWEYKNTPADLVVPHTIACQRRQREVASPIKEPSSLSAYSTRLKIARAR